MDLGLSFGSVAVVDIHFGLGEVMWTETEDFPISGNCDPCCGPDPCCITSPTCEAGGTAGATFTVWRGSDFP